MLQHGFSSTNALLALGAITQVRCEAPEKIILGWTYLLKLTGVWSWKMLWRKNSKVKNKWHKIYSLGTVFKSIYFPPLNKGLCSFFPVLLRLWSWRSMWTRTRWSTWSPPRRTSSRTWRTTAASSTSLRRWAPPARTRWPSPGPSWAWATTGRRAKNNNTAPAPTPPSPTPQQSSAVQHLPLSLTSVSKAIGWRTLGAARVPILPFLRMLDERQHKRPLFFFYYVSIFFFGCSETLGGGRMHGHKHKKDSAFKRRRRQPERLLCQNQTLTVNIVILLLVIASFETGTLRQ